MCQWESADPNIFCGSEFRAAVCEQKSTLGCHLSVAATDDIYLRALRKYHPSRHILEICDDRTRFDIHDGRVLTVFCLEGNLRHEEESRQGAITVKARHSRRAAARRMLQYLDDFTKASPYALIVVAGFDPAKEDQRIVTSLWETLAELPVKTPVYWFSTKEQQVDLDSRIQDALDDLKDDNRFFLLEMENWPQLKSDSVLQSSNAAYQIAVPGPKIVTLEQKDKRRFQDMVILTQDILRTPLPSKKENVTIFRDFLAGHMWPNWVCYAAGLVFEREFYPKLLKKIEHHLANESINNGIILIGGHAGTGRTTTLQYMAWHIAKNNHPVVYIPGGGHQPDWFTLSRFCENLQARQEGKKQHKVRTLIVWDEGFSDSAKHYGELASRLQSRSMPVLVLGSTFGAEADQNIIQQYNSSIDFASDTNTIEIKDVAFYCEKMNNGLGKDSESFLNFLQSIDPDILRTIDTLVEGKHTFIKWAEDDFFLALYNILPETRLMLSAEAEKEIKEQTNRIAHNLQEIFAGKHTTSKNWGKLLPLVAVASQYNVHPPFATVLRALGDRYFQLWTEEKPWNLFKGLLYEDWMDQDENRELVLRIRNERIAEIGLRQYSPQNILSYIKKLFMAMSPDNTLEREFYRLWLKRMRNPTVDNHKPLFDKYRKDLADILEEFTTKCGEDVSCFTISDCCSVAMVAVLEILDFLLKMLLIILKKLGKAWSKHWLY